MPPRLALVVLLVAPLACDDAPASSDAGTDAGSTGSSPTPDSTTTQADPPSTSGTSADTTGTDPEASSSGSSTGEPGSTETGGSSETGAVPTDVPLLLWSMHGGRFARSCDQGQTWSEVWEHDPAADCYHDADALYQPAVYGDGLFVTASGWGPSGAIYTSSDGATWTRRDGAQLLEDPPNIFSNGVFHDGARFIAIGSLLSDDGVTWTLGGADYRPPGVSNVRRTRVAAEEGMVIVEGNDGRVWVSTDWGASWSDPEASVGVCTTSIQHRGDIAVHDGRIVIGSDILCFSDDAGASWSPGPDLGDRIDDLFVDDAGFVAYLGDQRVLTSPDGSAWTEVGVLPARCTAGAWGGAPGVFVGFEEGGEGRVVRSIDGGATWSTATTIPLGPGCTRQNLELHWVPAQTCG